MTIVAMLNSVEKIELTVVKESPCGIGDKIGKLNHRGQMTVHEKWCLYDVVNFSPKSARRVILTHCLSKSCRDGLILVLYYHPQTGSSVL